MTANETVVTLSKPANDNTQADGSPVVKKADEPYCAKLAALLKLGVVRFLEISLRDATACLLCVNARVDLRPSNRVPENCGSFTE